MLLDTNVISEMWRPKCSPSVRKWLNAQPESRFHLCTPVLAEIRAGIERLPPGARRDGLGSLADRLVNDVYQGRILSFDTSAALVFGRIAAARERLGRRLEAIDGMIAAIALAKAMPLVTRNVADFADLGLTLIDPFTSPVT